MSKQARSKQEFLVQLRNGLSGLPQNDIEERLMFYSEIVDDRMEEGLSEEEAVLEIGNIDELIGQIVADTPLTKLVKEKITPKRRMKGWEIVLLILGAPIWVSLLIAAVSIILSLYAVVWSVIVSLWLVFASLILSALGGIAAGIGFTFSGNGLTGIAATGAGIVCAGLSVFLFFGCRMATKGTLLLTKKIILEIKNCFMKKEEVY